MDNSTIQGEEGVVHLVLIPMFAQGHMIPMIDIARLLARRGALVTVVTTPANAARITPTIDRIVASGLPVRFVPLEFPAVEVGLPKGCESLDSIPSRELIINFNRGTKLLRAPLLNHLRAHGPPVSCIVSDFAHAWTHHVAVELGVPRLVFHGYCSFALLSVENLHRHKTYEAIASGSEPFVLPGMPQRIEMTRNQLPRPFHVNAKYREIFEEFRESELKSDGVLVNSFEELEPGYGELLREACGKEVWTIGPVSLSANGSLDMAQRGNKAAIDEDQCLSWLDSKEPDSVIYVSFGSMGKFPPNQLMELGLGLRASGRPFIWVIKSVPKSSEMERWLSDTFDGDDSNSLVIKGWAPQVMILSHRAVGGFVTHCGWNSTLEAVCAGVPMITWPMFGEQFLNEKLVVEVLGTGVSMGVKESIDWFVADEKKDEVVVAVRQEEIVKAVEKLMDGGEEAEARREKAKELGLKAKRAVEEGGSSYTNLTRLIEHVASQSSTKKK